MMLKILELSNWTSSRERFITKFVGGHERVRLGHWQRPVCGGFGQCSNLWFANEFFFCLLPGVEWKLLYKAQTVWSPAKIARHSESATPSRAASPNSGSATQCSGTGTAVSFCGCGRKHLRLRPAMTCRDFLCQDFHGMSLEYFDFTV